MSLFTNSAESSQPMIVGLGTDLIDVARVEQKLRDDPGMINELFTPSEISYCEAKHRPAQHFAARFAAKEALLKALGTGWRDGLSWREIEIRHDEQGRPLMFLSGKVEELSRDRNVLHIHVSLAHTASQAAGERYSGILICTNIERVNASATSAPTKAVCRTSTGRWPRRNSATDPGTRSISAGTAAIAFARWATGREGALVGRLSGQGQDLHLRRSARLCGITWLYLRGPDCSRESASACSWIAFPSSMFRFWGFLRWGYCPAAVSAFREESLLTRLNNAGTTAIITQKKLPPVIARIRDQLPD